MQLTEDQPIGDYCIRAYEPGLIRVNETTYRSSLVISTHKLITDWPPQRLSDLKNEHLEVILSLKPTIILLGTGKEFHIIPPPQLATLYEAGLGVECMDTGAACRTFTALASEGREVVAALLID